MRYVTGGLALALIATTVPAIAQGLEKGQEYTIVLPAGAMMAEGSDWTDIHTIYGVDVNAMVVEPGALPRMLSMEFEKLDGREIEFRSRGPWLKLRFRDERDRMERLNQFVVAPGEAVDLVNHRLVGVGAEAFGETDIPPDLWPDLARYAYSLEGERLERPTTFRGERYMVVSIGTWNARFNTARLNPAQRTAIVISELMERVKSVGELADVGFGGLLLRMTVPYGNFVTSTDYGEDTLDWYIPGGWIQQLLDFEITSQDFVDQSVVVVNETRVAVALANQG